MPNFSASALRFGFRSTPTILLAPARRAPWMTLSPMPPRPNTTTLSPGCTLAVLITAPIAGRHAAADIADLVERGILADLRQRDLRQHREVGERRAPHVVVHHVLADREAARAIGHHALALGGADLGAQVRLARQAALALATLGRVERNDVIALLQRSDPGAHIHDDAGTLVPEDRRKQPLRVRARARELIRMADTGSLQLHQHLAGLRALQVHGDDFQRLAGGVGDCGTCFHE